MDSEMIKVDVLFGSSESRAWIEPEVMADGRIRLIGMGSRTDFDRYGNVTARVCEPTGAVIYMAEPEKKPWWMRIFT